MDSNLIIFIVFAILLLLAISIALSIYLVKEKGLETWKGLLLGLLPLVGHLIISFMKATDKTLVKELYDRDIMTKEEFDKTMSLNLDEKKSSK